MQFLDVGEGSGCSDSTVLNGLAIHDVRAVLSITNTMGYMKCDKNHQKKMGSYLMSKAKDNLSTD